VFLHRKDIYAQNQGKNHEFAQEGHQKPVLRYISITYANMDGGFAIGSIKTIKKENLKAF